MFGTPTIPSNYDGGAGRCPFVSPRCPWPCPPNCRCPGECPMDVTESEDTMMEFVETVDAIVYSYPFAQPRPGGECAMDVDEFDAGQHFNVTNGVHEEQTYFAASYGDNQFASAGQQCYWPENLKVAAYVEQWTADFTVTNAAYSGMLNIPGDDEFASIDQQFSSWSYSVISNVHQAQIPDHDLHLVGVTADDIFGSHSDLSDSD